MALLSEDDQRAILGANFREEIAEADLASGVRDGERNKRGEIAKADDNKLLGGYMTLVGLVMIIASWVTVTGQALMIQIALSAAILILGVGLFARSRQRGQTARMELSALQ